MKSTPTIILAMILITMTGTACGQNVERDTISTAYTTDAPRTTSTSSEGATIRFPSRFDSEEEFMIQREPTFVGTVHTTQNAKFLDEYKSFFNSPINYPAFQSFLGANIDEYTNGQVYVRKNEIKLIHFSEKQQLAGSDFRLYVYEVRSNDTPMPTFIMTPKRLLYH